MTRSGLFGKLQARAGKGLDLPILAAPPEGGLALEVLGGKGLR